MREPKFSTNDVLATINIFLCESVNQIVSLVVNFSIKWAGKTRMKSGFAF